MTSLPTVGGPRDGRVAPPLMFALGYVSMATSLSTDLYLPAFPSIAEHFGVGPSVVQLTLTAFMVGSALGQLIIGSVSDALGRRRTLLAGLAVFTLCAFAAAASPTLGVLIGVRAVQGFAAASGAVLARAVIADVATGKHTSRAFSLLFVMIALGPAIASPIGGWLVGLGGWRAPLVGLAVLAAGMLIAAAALIPESLPITQRHPFSARVLAGNLASLLRRPAYLGYAMAFAFGYGALITYIGSSSFIAQSVFGLTPVGYALTFTMSSSAVMVGSWLGGVIGPRRGSPWTLRLGQLLALGAAIGLCATSVLGGLHLIAYLALVCVFAVGMGLVMSMGSALAIGQAIGVAGAGSAMLGFGQFTIGALAAPLGGLFGSHTAVPTTVWMTVFAAVGLLGGEIARRSLRRADPAGPLHEG